MRAINDIKSANTIGIKAGQKLSEMQNHNFETRANSCMQIDNNQDYESPKEIAQNNPNYELPKEMCRENVNQSQALA